MGCCLGTLEVQVGPDQGWTLDSPRFDLDALWGLSK